MTQQLPPSGRMKMSDIKSNLEITSSTNLSLGDPVLRALAGVKTGSIKMSDFYSANELESLILAEEPENNAATGYYQSFWGDNDRPEFGTKSLIGAYDDHPGNKFVFAVDGNQPRTTFRALVMNNVIYYEEDATTYEYLPDSNTTVWTWVGYKAGLVAGTVYELSYLIGPSNAAAPPPAVGTFPTGQGTDWTLTFEDDFDTATMDFTKWKRALWYILDDTVRNPVGVDNFDLSASRLRIWPLLNAGTWIRRDFTTHGIFEQVTGFWEIKCKAPANKGMRISFWLMNHDTTARPIVSAMQALMGYDLAGGWSEADGDAIDFSFGVQPTTDGQWLMYRRYNDMTPTPVAINLSQNEYVFGIKKTSTAVHFYLNGTELATQELLGPNTMTLPQYMVVTLDYSDSTPNVTDTIQNATGAFEVDYVRAWIPSAGGGTTDPGGEEPAPTPSAYVPPLGKTSAQYPYMTFRDEFNGAGLDATKWTDYIWFDTSNEKGNIKVENGTLYMWPALPFASGTDYNAMVHTEGKFFQKYGYFEIRAKLPIGRGCWPSFWMYNRDLRDIYPEIDIMEAYSGGNDFGNDWADANLHPIRFASTVFGESGAQQGTFNSANTLGYVDLSENWHVYGVHWSRTEIRFEFDGTTIGTITYVDNASMDMRLFLALDLWLGGLSGQANTAETPVGQSNSFMIDYVRAWALADNTTIVEGTLPALPESEGGKGSGTTVPVTKPIVAFIGNSTTWGYKTLVGGRVDIPYPLAFAHRQPNYDVRNHGINSTQTQHWIDGTNGVPQTFAAFMADNPEFDYVCIDLGNLDQFDMSTTQFKNNLITMIGEIRKVSGRSPVLISPFVTEFTGLPAYVQAMRDAGSETQTPFIDKYTWSNNIVINGTGVVRDYIPDGIHPSDQMYVDGGAYVSGEWARVTGTTPGVVGTQLLPSFWGMHTTAPQHEPWPLVSFDSIRLWDIWPGISWQSINTSAGVYDWSVMDAHMAIINPQGKDVIYTFGYVPLWVTGSATAMPTETAWVDFVTAITARYGASIKYWEIWNEPNETIFWTGTHANMVRLSELAAPIIRAAGGTVLSPCPQGSSAYTWFNGYLAAGGNPHFDILAFHSYTYEAPETLVEDLVNLRSTMTNYGVSKPIWDTEHSWGDNTWPFGISDSLKRAYVARIHILSHTQGIARSFWYSYDNDTWGTLAEKPTDTLLTTGVAYNSIYDWLTNKVVAPYVLTSTKYSVGLTDSSGYSGEIVWNTGSSGPYAHIVKSAHNRMRTLTGTTTNITGGSSVPIAQEPILFDNQGTSGGGGEPPPPAATLTPAVPTGHPHTYTLTFNEEFDGSNLNRNIWNDAIWYAQSDSLINYQVSDGALHIWPADGFVNRTIDTDFKYYQTYGFFECESKLCKGRGVWPAFWLLNHDNGSERPEVDIMETYPGGGLASWWSDADLNPINYSATLHYPRAGDIQGETKLREQSPFGDGVRLDLDYHKYGCLWESDGFTFFFDGVQIGAKMMTSSFSIRMYILLDVWFGSASGTPNDAETPKGMSNAFSTRYVRAWRKN